MMGHERDRLFKIAVKTNTTETWEEARKQRRTNNYAIKKGQATVLYGKTT